MDDKLSEARMREIEDWLRGYGPVSLEYAETLTAEIRRLREMVDALLDGLPWVHIHLVWYGGPLKECPYCKHAWREGDGEKHADDCPYQRVQKARDWGE